MKIRIPFERILPKLNRVFRIWFFYSVVRPHSSPTPMKPTLSLGLLAAFSSSLLMQGCYFAHGVNVTPSAFSNPSSTDARFVIYTIQGETWHTGNMHMPFDFTVYRYPVEYQLKVPAGKMHVTQEEIELFICDRKVGGVRGNVDIEGDRLRIKIEYQPYAQQDMTYAISASPRLVKGAPPSTKCTTLPSAPARPASTA